MYNWKRDTSVILLCWPWKTSSNIHSMFKTSLQTHFVLRKRAGKGGFCNFLQLWPLVEYQSSKNVWMSRNKLLPWDFISIEMNCIHSIRSTVCWPFEYWDILYIKSEFELYESVFVVCRENELWTELPPVFPFDKSLLNSSHLWVWQMQSQHDHCKGKYKHGAQVSEVKRLF